jgi:uncharacterized protein (DUF362 family)
MVIMERRDFLKKSIAAGIAAGSIASLGRFSDIIASNLSTSNYDMVAIKGGDADTMFDLAIDQIGGMKNFVKKGQDVVVKPNIGWDVIPELGANTNPKLVGRIVKRCYDAGAKNVYVFDHTCDEWTKCYGNSGIERAAKDAGAKVVSGASERYYQEVSIPQGKVLKKAKVHELILQSAVFINVPVLKHHGSGRVTVALKNLMGIVWDRRYWHQNGLHQCIADFGTFRKPDLNIVDAYLVMMRNGPRGTSAADVVEMKSQIISTDMVAADSAAAKMFGLEPDQVPHITLARELSVGTMDLDKLNIKRIIL